MSNTDESDHYKGLPRLLYMVRWVQHLLAIVAEIIILLSFAMSGMDVSLGGSMASVPLLKITWASMFALGIDTAFALSWVRVRQALLSQSWIAFGWNIVLALGMSVVVFQPIAIQLLQQSLDISFNDAVNNLGINIVFLTYARAAVAVALGAILAMTNVEGGRGKQELLASQPPQSKLLERFVQYITPRIGKHAPHAQTEICEEAQPESPAHVPSGDDIAEQQTVLLPKIAVQAQAPVAQAEARPNTTPQERASIVGKLDITGLSAAERVRQVLNLFPNISDRELGRLSTLAPATAKKHREALTRQSSDPATTLV